MLSDCLLRIRVKYLAVGVLCLFGVIVFYSSHDHRMEEEQLGFIQYKKNIVARHAEEMNKNRKDGARREAKDQQQQDPADFQVQFLSGKEMAEEVDNEQKSFQVHKVKMTNIEKTKVVIDCEDPFSNFGKVITPGAAFEFRVTDLFAKRHYWCSARYGTSVYSFKAYGEGAPRDNNQISLHKEGAFINGKLMNIEDRPMSNRFPKGPSSKDLGVPKNVVEDAPHSHYGVPAATVPDHPAELENIIDEPQKAPS